VRAILGKYIPTCEVGAFGARVRTGAKPFSDIDLAIISPAGLPIRQLALLSSAFEESDLPVKVDVIEWHSLNPEFRKRISEDHQVVFLRNS
jgi:predicted nucleotidyltransferase